MAQYVKSTNFAAKDSLATGNANKIVKGAEIDAEFNAIATAIATKADSSASLPVSFRNKIRNGSFIVNQRGVSGTVTLASGAYGHDGWKAGTSGCTYTFATSGNVTVITITSGSLIQPIEAGLIEGGVYALSHQGTAQARIGVSGAAASGSYAAASTGSPLLSATALANVQCNVEFSTGTIDRVQFELGTTATTFEARPQSIEETICRRYYQEIGTPGGNDIVFGGYLGGAGAAYHTIVYPVKMRAIPTVGNGGTAFTTTGLSSSTFGVVGTTSARLDVAATGAVFYIWQNGGGSCRLTLSAEL